MSYPRTPWYIQRSIGNNPLRNNGHNNTTNGLESIVEDASVDYTPNNPSYAARIAYNIFSAMPNPIKKIVLAGTATLLLYAGGACVNKNEPTPPPAPYNPPAITTPVPTDNATTTPAPIVTPKPVTPTPVPVKYLTNAEKEQLTGYLEKISLGDKPAEDDADRILRNELLENKFLDVNSLEMFFKEYFSQRPLTENLHNYLNNRSFWTGREVERAKLQQALSNTIFDIINRRTNAYIQSDKTSLTRDSPLVQTIINSHYFLNDMVRLYDKGIDRREETFQFYAALAKNHASLYGTDTLDPNLFPFANAFRAQAHRNLVDAANLNGPALDQIIENLKLNGTKRDIFKDYGVLVTDNNGLDETQLRVISSILGSVPKEMYDLTIITVADFLDTKGLGSRGRAGINIFGLKVGTAGENGFPSDVPPYNADVFSLVVAHELNHRVKANYIDNNGHLREREEALLKQAGLDDQNYLRSSTPGNGALFQNAPQEFFASIANQYFASSEHTLRLALERFAHGRAEPLNQFLFFADVYSRGSSSTLFYTLDTSGKLTRREIPIARDNQGYITGLNIGANQYRFQLDGKGNVLAVNKLQANP